MKGINRIIIVGLLLILNCKSANLIGIEDRFFVEVVLDSFGKCNLPESTIKRLDIPKELITSSLYGNLKNETKLTSFPINDKVFNYDYFNKNIYNNIKGKTVKLFVKKYNFDDEIIYLVEAVQLKLK